MIRADVAALKIAIETPRPPSWARSSARMPTNESAALEAAFCAGAGLAALDALLRLQPPWLGVWRRRLALQAAAASVALTGRREDEAALRDAWMLRRPGDDPGPAGRALGAWRVLAERPDALTSDRIAGAALALATPLGDALPAIVAAARDLAAGDRPAVVAAADIAGLVVARRPGAELLGLWLADAVLAARLHWEIALPLLVGQLLHPSLKTGPAGRRPRPGDPDWSAKCCFAIARAAGAACDLGADLSRRAERLQAAAPKLRAKAATAVVAALLDDDALTAAQRVDGISDRGLRRLFDRLVSLGAVRELSGRDSFRLYGL